MGTENFNRQFILLDFADLDNPDFLAFTRSPEFSTYLVMRRHVWRSREPHYMGLHTLYADGALACSLEREQIAALLGLSLVSISNDIQALARRAVIESRRTGRQNIFVLGRWARDAGAYYEHFHLDRLYVRSKENLISGSGAVRDKENLTSAVNPMQPSDVKESFAINREENTQENREKDRSNIRSTTTPQEKGKTRAQHPPSSSPIPTGTPSPRGAQPHGGRASEAAAPAAARRELAGFIEDMRRELNDRAPAGATLTRAVNLYRRSGLSPEAFRDLLYDARRRTQQHTGAIRARPIERGAGALPVKPKMAYFFGVLENALGLGAADGPGAVGADAPGPSMEAPGPRAPAEGLPSPVVDLGRGVVDALADAAMRRNVNWRLARQLAREDPHLLAAWLDHGGTWALARDPGAELAKLVRSGEHPPRMRSTEDARQSAR
jgi:hypothetical protein